jgi:UDP-2,4-diacetamido-2,4,6-trideoxy-beta-L-altropyranose hydrolase
MNQTKRLIIFRVDANPDIGMGHLSRCLKLAEHLNADFELFFHCAPETEAFFKDDRYPKKFSTKEFEDLAAEERPFILIVDGYQFGEEYFRSLKQYVPQAFVLAFEDDREKAGYLVNGYINFGLTSELYAPSSRLRETSLWGLKNFPVPSNLGARERNEISTPKSLGITMGGSDPEKQSLRILGLSKGIMVRTGLEKLLFILGPAFEDVESFRKQAKAHSGVEVVHAPQKIYEVFASADVFLNAGGMTCLELGFVGTPQLVLSLAQNQIKTCRGLEEKKLATYLGHFSLLSDVELMDQISAKVRNYSSLREIAQNFQALASAALNNRSTVSSFFSKIFEQHLSDTYSIEEVEKEYTYDVMPAKAHEAARWASHESMVNRFKLCKAIVDWRGINRWLDIGSGTGDFLTEVETSCHLDKYLGVDLSETMIAMAQQKTYQTQNVRFVKENFLHLDPSLKFDFVSSIGVLQKCGVPPFLFFSKIYSLLKPGGNAFIDTKNSKWSRFTNNELLPYQGHKWFDPEEVQGIAELVGFKVLKKGGFLPQTNEVVPLNESHSIFFHLVRD